ncbi:MAG: DUF2510 domain-containing protein [Ilumatobacter sp.]|uniref:DUF2510 domain-containing protein n=1 Tax=Ilumatobacter sp. TaxID=1967498 RepID=UPI003C75ED95
MRYVDAPRPGWYPDPQSRTSLRWWDGFDWTDIRRAPPSNAELLAAEQLQEFYDANELVAAGRGAATKAAAGMSRQDSTQIVEEVRMAARQEIDRAAQEFSDRATTAVRRVSPLISEYTSKLTRWFRRALIVAFVLLAAYFIFQVIAQQAFFDWLGDRIDNISDETGFGFPVEPRTTT